MSEWKEYRLLDLMDVIGGGTPKTSNPKYWGGDIPWLSVVDFGNSEKKVYVTEKSITKIGLNNSSTKVLKKGQIIISARGTVGELAMLGKDMAFNQSCYGLNGKIDICTNDFLYYLMKYKISELKRNSHGAVFDTITKSTFETVWTKLPDLITQKNIAEILSSLDDKIELNNKINQELESIAQLLFKRWFVYFEFPNEKGEPYKSSGGEMIESELGVIPKGWEVKSFSDVSEIKLGGTPSSMKVEYWGGEIPWVNSGELNKNFIIEGAKGITELGLKKSATKLIPKYSTLIAITGATLGQVSYSFIDACYNQSVVSITSDIQLNEYIHQYVLCNIKVIISHQTGGAQQHINKGDVEKTNIIIPNPIVLAHFSEMISLVYRKIENSLFENQELSKLRDSLLPKLISGKLQLNDN